jgi:hypothetical protein
VVLNIVFGLIEFLEIWPGWDGGEVASELPAAGTLHFATASAE